MTIETIPKTEKIPDFTSLEFEIPNLASADEKKNTIEQSFRAVFNQVPIRIDIFTEVDDFHRNTSDSDVSLVYLEFKISTNEQENIANLQITIRKNKDGTYKSTTAILNTNRELKGLGRVLWEKIPNLMEKFAIKFNASVLHEVERDPNKSLTIEKWNELFYPILEKYGYKRTMAGFWEKIYRPENK